MSERSPIIGIVMGSANDAETLRPAKEIFERFGISCEMRVLSAHRTPVETVQWVSQAKASGMKVIIAAAGLAAHLAGVCAAHTSLPVLGVPVAGGPLNGFDALLSTVQMPRGTPVATFAVGSSGSVNAALFAVKILALSDKELDAKLVAYHQDQTAQVLASDAQLQRTA